MQCTHCGHETRSRGPFGEALHPQCWEEQDEGIARVERRLAEKHGYDTSYYARVDAEAKPSRVHLSTEADELFDDGLYEQLQQKREQRYLENDANWR